MNGEIDTGYPGIDEALRYMQRTTLGTRMVVTLQRASIEVHDVGFSKVLVAEIPPNIQLQIPLTHENIVALRRGIEPADG